jgi:hypothetical protein
MLYDIFAVMNFGFTRMGRIRGHKTPNKTKAPRLKGKQEHTVDSNLDSHVECLNS